MIQVFLGEGHVETSAAIGTAIRAAGYGLKVHIVFFGSASAEDITRSGTLNRLPGVVVDLVDSSDKFSLLDSDSTFLNAGGENFDVVVFDQVLSRGEQRISGERILELLKVDHGKTEIILTGNYANEKVIGVADLVTGCECEKC